MGGREVLGVRAGARDQDRGSHGPEVPGSPEPVRGQKGPDAPVDDRGGEGGGWWDWTAAVLTVYWGRSDTKPPPRGAAGNVPRLLLFLRFVICGRAFWTGLFLPRSLEFGFVSIAGDCRLPISFLNRGRGSPILRDRGIAEPGPTRIQQRHAPFAFPPPARREGRFERSREQARAHHCTVTRGHSCISSAPRPPTAHCQLPAALHPVHSSEAGREGQRQLAVGSPSTRGRDPAVPAE